MKIIVLAFIAITSLNAKILRPLTDPNQWEVLEYSGISANKVEFKNKKLFIEVNSSAAPLIYPLEKPTSIKKIKCVGVVKGDIQLKGKRQGAQGADDFSFRLGLVVEGDKTLSFFEKMVAPGWIKKLHSLAKSQDSKASGIKVISFFNVIQDEELLGQKRTHPLSELLVENFIVQSKKDGSFSIELSSKIPTDKILGLWISSDGDDTDSKFKVEISKLELTL